MMGPLMKARSETVKRVPGRPRSARAHRAILDAALDSFIENGYEGMSIESVAERAGVGKTTIYRRWPSKKELIVAAMDTLFEQFHPSATGDLRADLVSNVGRVHHFIMKTKAGEALPRMVWEVASGTPLGHAYFEKVMKPRFGWLLESLAAAKERGELRPDLDVDLALASVVGSMMFLRLTRTMPKRKGDLPERLVTQLIEGMQP